MKRAPVAEVDTEMISELVFAGMEEEKVYTRLRFWRADWSSIETIFFLRFLLSNATPVDIREITSVGRCALALPWEEVAMLASRPHAGGTRHL